jgi:hypothetical protein
LVTNCLQNRTEIADGDIIQVVVHRFGRSQGLRRCRNRSYDPLEVSVVWPKVADPLKYPVMTGQLDESIATEEVPSVAGLPKL